MHSKDQSFSSRNPVLFGLIVGVATILLAGIVVTLNIYVGNDPLSSDYSPVRSSFMGRQFGMVRIEGEITDAEKLIDWMNELREDKSVPGIIVRINSPGGGLGPSQEIFQAMKKLAAKKPVVVSMGSIAASGGYYAALPASHIMANHGTLTGNIGVKMEIFQLVELMGKLGIGHEALSSGPYKAAGSSFAPMSEEHRKYFQAIIDDMQEQFVSDLAENRDMSIELAKELADGKAYTGNQALRLGLIDSIGTLDDAKEVLREICGLNETLPLLEMPKPSKSLISQIMEGLGTVPPAGLWPQNFDDWPDRIPSRLFTLPN